MGRTRGSRGGKVRKRRQQEEGGAQKVAALEQVEQGEIDKGGIEGTVLEGNQEQGEQHEAAFGSTGGGVSSEQDLDLLDWVGGRSFWNQVRRTGFWSALAETRKFKKMSLAITTLGISEKTTEDGDIDFFLLFPPPFSLFFHFPFFFPLPLFPSRSMHLIPTVLRSQTHTRCKMHLVRASFKACREP